MKRSNLFRIIGASVLTLSTATVPFNSLPKSSNQESSAKGFMKQKMTVLIGAGYNWSIWFGWFRWQKRQGPYLLRV